ncbi:hypothetical protein ACIA49_16640 [Kribbella sp. NPDC051587]|uniref:hypothetical protein n=1 Tax=Kribbella sp. NPDC051587 TaxID=3364119 RepID=UPI0037BA20A5
MGGEGGVGAAEDGEDLYGGCARAAGDVEPAVAEGGFGAEGGSVVAVEVPPAVVGDEVEAAVEFDVQGEAVVVDVGELAVDGSLAGSGGEAVAALDVTEVAEFEERMGSGRDVGEDRAEARPCRSRPRVSSAVAMPAGWTRPD